MTLKSGSVKDFTVSGVLVSLISNFNDPKLVISVPFTKNITEFAKFRLKATALGGTVSYTEPIILKIDIKCP